MANSNKYMNEYMKNRYRRRRLEAIGILGGKCVECGNSDQDDLEFDHIDPSTKSFTIARGSSFSDERWYAEIAKCQLLCGDCHSEKHKSNHPHGNVRRYWRGCRCDECRSDYNRYNRELKRRRRSAT